MSEPVELNQHSALASAVAAEWDRDVLVVRGPDAITYLQGQLSADVVTLEPGQSTMSLLLAPNGKLEAVLRLWRSDETVVVVDTDAGAGDAVENRLKRFMIRTDATIERLDWGCIAVRGPGSEGFAADAHGAELVGLGLWPGVDGIDLVGPAPEVPEGLATVTSEQLEALRIRAGWPSYPAEINDGVIPAEIGPWLITAAVSFTKGCYVGQELTARIDSRGNNVPRQLRCIESPQGAAVAPGDEIVQPELSDTPVGTVTSAALDPATDTYVSLGFVKRSADADARFETRPL